MGSLFFQMKGVSTSMRCTVGLELCPQRKGLFPSVLRINDWNSLNHLVGSGALLSKAPRSSYGCRRGGFRRHARAAQGNHSVDVLHAGLG
jgi:hypothetical protein